VRTNQAAGCTLPFKPRALSAPGIVTKKGASRLPWSLRVYFGLGRLAVRLRIELAAGLVEQVQVVVLPGVEVGPEEVPVSAE